MRWILSTLILFLAQFAFAEGDRTYGYTDDVRAERETVDSSVFVVFDVDPPPQENVKNKVFTEKLTKEFKEKYEKQFGNTDVEQSLLFVKPNSFYVDERGSVVTAEDIIRKEKAFGEYLMRRLLEYHIDHQMKEDPDTRPVYELKEKLRKTEVKISKGYKVEAQYASAANEIVVKIKTPYFDLQSDTAMNGSGDLAEETTVKLTRRLTRTIKIDNYYLIKNEELKMVLRKEIDPDTDFDLSLTPNKKASASTEVYGIAGLSYRF
ncbi:MAG: hypothetical protein KDD25_02210 [Bdellovibrionales bacterium]|nr:hypothetical protein [Bdellovibrionales bacterium]